MKRLQKFTATPLALVLMLFLGVALRGFVGPANAATLPTENVTIEIWWHEYGPFTAYVKELI